MPPERQCKEYNNKMTVGQFADIVAEMRAAQKSYYRTRTHKSLEKSKELERTVDDIISKRAARKKEEQLNLFEETK